MISTCTVHTWQTTARSYIQCSSTYLGFLKTNVKQHLFVVVVCRGVLKTGVYSTTELSIWSPPAHHGQWAQCSLGSCWEVVAGTVSLSPSELLNIVAASRRRGRWVNATFKTLNETMLKAWTAATVCGCKSWRLTSCVLFTVTTSWRWLSDEEVKVPGFSLSHNKPRPGYFLPFSEKSFLSTCHLKKRLPNLPLLMSLLHLWLYI